METCIAKPIEKEIERQDKKITLVALAHRINEQHHLAQQHAQTAVDHALNAGKMLLEAKAQISHGEWLSWLKANCSFSERTAQTYMQVAKTLTDLSPEKAQRVADLPLRQAVRSITRVASALKALPPASGETFIDQVEAGKGVAEAWRQAKFKNVVRIPQEIRPITATLSRKMKLFRNEELRQWQVLFGPNGPGENLPELLEAAKLNDEYKEGIGAAEEMEAKAKDLIEEAERLKQTARELKKNADHYLRSRISTDHGEIYAFAETVTFRADPAYDDELKSLSAIEVMDNLLSKRGEVVVLSHGMWGDVRHQCYSSVLDVGEVDGWSKIGSFDNVAGLL